MPELGDKLKYFRERNKISQLDLEIAINASQGSISRIENNKINPTKETVLQISNYLSLNDYEIAYLIGHTQNPASQQEIDLAKDETKKYFAKKTTLAYMTDDRSRLIDMSLGFKLLAEIDEKNGVNFNFNPSQSFYLKTNLD